MLEQVHLRQTLAAELEIGRLQMDPEVALALGNPVGVGNEL